MLSYEVGLGQTNDPDAGKTIVSDEQAIHLLHRRQQTAPAEGSPAPISEVIAPDARRLPISELWQDGPVVLLFTSMTCDHMIRAREDTLRLYQRFGNTIDFAMIYIREAHPVESDEFVSEFVEIPVVSDPATDSYRRLQAGICQRFFEFPFPVFTDPVDDRTAVEWAGWPSRFYVVDGEGIVVFQGMLGPWGLKPTKDHELIIDPVPEWLAETGNVKSVEEFLEGFLE